MHDVLLPIALVLTALAGCGQATAPADAGSPRTDTGAADAGASDTGLAPDLDAGVACSGHDATSFPTFDRSCALDTDCVVVGHQTDCCGTLAAMGITRGEQARFASAEAQCLAQYPACGCDSGTVITDDGSSPPPGTGTSGVVVRCASGVCTSSARASTPCGGASCAPTQVCVAECSGVPRPDGGAPLPSHCVDVPPACASSTDCACFGGVNPCPTGGCVTVDHGAPVCVCA